VLGAVGEITAHGFGHEMNRGRRTGARLFKARAFEDAEHLEDADAPELGGGAVTIPYPR